MLFTGIFILYSKCPQTQAHASRPLCCPRRASCVGRKDEVAAFSPTMMAGALVLPPGRDGMTLLMCMFTRVGALV